MHSFLSLLGLQSIVADSVAPPVGNASEFYFDSYNSSGANSILIYLPQNWTANMPLAIFYNGDGRKGSHSDATANLGSGNGVQTVFTGNFANGSNDALYSCILKVNGVQVAKGQPNGTFVGTGITTSSFNRTATNGAISITFSAPVPNGHAVTVEYQYSELVNATEGPPSFLNFGDMPEGIIVACVQLRSALTDYTVADHWTAAINYCIAEFDINTNRVTPMGLSRGEFQVRRILEAYDSLTYKPAAYIGIAGTYSSIPWTSLTNTGGFWVHGSDDGTVTYAMGTVFSGTDGESLNIFPEAYCNFDGGHSGATWDDCCFDRRDRTDAAGDAWWDYISEIKAYSLDTDERATLHVERAEREITPMHWRKAVNQVSALSAGALKTSLEGRLGTVLDLIGTVYSLDWGAATNTTSGNYNNLTSGATSAAVNNMVDVEGGASTIDFQVVSQLTTAGTKVNIQARMQRQQWGTPTNFTYDGAIVEVGLTTGQIKFTQLPAGTYKLYVYCCNANSTGEPVDRELTIAISGETTQVLNSVHNTFRPFVFNTINPVANEIVVDIDATGTDDGRIQGFDLIRLP